MSRIVHVAVMVAVLLADEPDVGGCKGGVSLGAAVMLLEWGVCAPC